ncbi:ATP-binding protein [Brevibacillus agri]|nr:ATP-binding protein [Brevibacillus agri]MBG9568613.1 histidine kinase [Brevibacillus agri]MCG5251729.1 ATP-binding protein [Brevibacillus agri]MED4570274.1 ATP-binding protein [Brevibacillus agri]
MVTAFTKNRRVWICVLMSGALFLTMTCLSIAGSYYNTMQSVRLSIANQSMKTAAAAASRIDVASYEQFLQHPVKENPAYERLTSQLSQVREQFGVLYLYLLQINPDGSGGKVMVAAHPPDSGIQFQIGDPCYVNAEQIAKIRAGETYYSDIIRDPHYGVYMSAGAPLLGKDGRLAGIVGVDTDMAMVEGIGKDVVRNSVPVFVFHGLFVVVLIVLILGLSRWYQREIRVAVGETEEHYQDELRSVISSIRSIRHDFVNHMQVLYGLIECGYFDKARDYIQSLLKETKLLDLTVRIANPALMVLFHTKWEQAKSKQIVMQFAECPDPFEGIPSIDLVKIMSNLIDNAIDAAEMADGEKRIRIACRREDKQYVFEVENTGAEISPEQRAHIFTVGYTTKPATRSNARGAGLPIVQAVVSKHNGSIEIVSEHGMTRFTVILPAK